MYEYYTKVEKVIDGDTIDVFIDLGFSIWHKERIRLAGIDTPEKNTPLGKALKTFLVDNLEGKIIKLQVTKTDKYGRYLGTVFLKDSLVSINDQLVKANLAKSYFGESKTNLWSKEETLLDKVEMVLK
jgi:micrococcal nuclease